jgi:hypothetical protein
MDDATGLILKKISLFLNGLKANQIPNRPFEKVRANST